MTSTELYLRLLHYVAPYWRVFALSLLGMVIVTPGSGAGMQAIIRLQRAC